MDLGGVPPLPLPLELEAFKKLIAFGRKRTGGGAQRFLKKVDIPSVELPAEQTCRSALNLADRVLLANSLASGLPLRQQMGGCRGTGGLLFQLISVVTLMDRAFLFLFLTPRRTEL